MTNHVAWVDVPTLDLNRAMKFYGAVLDCRFEDGFLHDGVAVIIHAAGDVSGCLFEHPKGRPSMDGPLVYFNVSGRLDAALEAVVAQGGEVLREKHAIGPFGFRAIVRDSEGNRIALHTP